MLSFRLFALPVLSFALLGCAAQAETPSVAASPPPAPRVHESCVAPGTWFDPLRDVSLSTPQALARLKAPSVVLLGETHVVPDHHRWHVQTVAQLFAQRPDMILGFESFPRRVQPALDQWVAGKLTEKQFLERSEWDTVWRYDPELYLPLFHFARINKIPMVALNVDRSLLSRVSESGWAKVPASERRGVGDPAPPSRGYIDMLGKVFGRHGNGHGGENGAPKGPGLEDPRFANFVDVQVTWDRAMAEAAASALNDARATGRDPQLVAIVGRGHLDYGYGIPHQLADLGVTDVTVAVPWDKLRPCAELRAQGKPPADLVFGLHTTEDYLPEDGANKPKLGVLIDTADDGVHVNSVVEGSIAETTGLKPGDVIVRAADQDLAKSADLVKIIQAMNPGTWLPLTVRRDGRTIELVARFPVIRP